ncbi:hypothetical protein F2P81_024429 [Scophthalmus maximus]|uniref:Uncharacterized protein n=1 Tax=Scophthalmus maximus TaxID=52904 RepID=A0A6A4RTZ0_SCOMX|nr:hypothetical protein F2P81_024429 [Scophthalmus maximus]
MKDSEKCRSSDTSRDFCSDDRAGAWYSPGNVRHDEDQIRSHFLSSACDSAPRPERNITTGHVFQVASGRRFSAGKDCSLDLQLDDTDEDGNRTVESDVVKREVLPLTFCPSSPRIRCYGQKRTTCETTRRHPFDSTRPSCGSCCRPPRRRRGYAIISS